MMMMMMERNEKKWKGDRYDEIWKMPNNVYLLVWEVGIEGIKMKKIETKRNETKDIMLMVD